MAIYLLTRTDHHGYDEYDAKVIRAESEVAARHIANIHTGDEGAIWHDEHLVRCDPVDYSGEPKEILGSFNAG